MMQCLHYAENDSNASKQCDDNADKCVLCREEAVPQHLVGLKLYRSLSFGKLTLTQLLASFTSLTNCMQSSSYVLQIALSFSKLKSVNAVVDQLLLWCNDSPSGG